MTTITIERELLEKVREALWQMTKQFNFGRLHESRLRDSEARVAAHDAMKALEEALSAPATAPEQRMKELEAELAATEIAIAEYRQQCLDNAAEIARLRAAPATAPAPTQLRQGECWPENTMAQWDYYRKLIAEGDTSSAPRDWFESLAEMRLIALPAQPAWHDAPTVPGAWICADKEHVKRTHTITPGILPVISKFGDRWYGPIPEDKQ